MARKIPPMDLMFYLLETPENPKHVGALQVYQLPPKAAPGYLNWLVDELKKAAVVAPFCWRPHFPRIGMPQWVEDTHIEIDYHIRHSALPKPGTMQELMTVVERLHASILDRSRPGWICQVIEGLEGNRFAMYTKIHHAYIDGMSGVKRLYGSLSASAGEKQVVPVWSFDPAAAKVARRSRNVGLIERAEKSGKAALSQAKAMTEMYLALAKLGLQALKLRESEVQLPFHAPRTPMNQPVKWDTRAVAVCSLPLDRVRAIALAMGGKVNDVVLTLVDAGLRDYLSRHDQRVDEPLIALCPMSLREKGDDTATTQVATVHVRLGSPEAAIKERMRQVIESSKVAKQDARSLSREALMDMVLFLAGIIELVTLTGMEHRMPPSFNVLVSNVPGPGEDELYMAGSRLLASYPISTLVTGGNLNATVLSHGNSLDFGLIADKHAMPDVSYVSERMQKHFVALEKAVLGKSRLKSGAAPKAPKTPAAKVKRAHTVAARSRTRAG